MRINSCVWNWFVKHLWNKTYRTSVLLGNDWLSPDYVYAKSAIATRLQQYRPTSLGVVQRSMGANPMSSRLSSAVSSVSVCLPIFLSIISVTPVQSELLIMEPIASFSLCLSVPSESSSILTYLWALTFHFIYPFSFYHTMMQGKITQSNLLLCLHTTLI